MKITKRFLALCILFMAIACNNKQEKQSSSDDKPVSQPGTIPVQNIPAPSNLFVTVDVSPMDMSYYPVDYPKLKMANGATPPPVARVIYSRPHLGKRHLFHQLLKYDEPWRLGANESTEIQFYKPVMIQDKKIAAGRYILYCIPHPDSWTIALNSNIDTWGLRQDTTKDIQRFRIPITTDNEPQEYFTLLFEKTGTGADLFMSWDSIEARLPIVF